MTLQQIGPLSMADLTFADRIAAIQLFRINETNPRCPE
jgi:hypothetical protein